MIHTQNIRSLTDFQRNASGHIKRLKDSSLPELLNVEGHAAIVVQTANAYQVCQIASITHSLQDIRVSLRRNFFIIVI